MQGCQDGDVLLRRTSNNNGDRLPLFEGDTGQESELATEFLLPTLAVCRLVVQRCISRRWALVH